MAGSDNYKQCFDRFETMDANDAKNLKSGYQIPLARYHIMDDLLDSMNPFREAIPTAVMNKRIDTYNIEALSIIDNKEESIEATDIYKNIRIGLNKQLNEMLSSPSFDIARDRIKLNALMDELKRIELMIN